MGFSYIFVKESPILSVWVQIPQIHFTFKITSFLIYDLTLFVVAFLLHKCFFIITFYYISFSLKEKSKKILHTELKTRWYPLQQKELLCPLKSLFYSLNCFLHCSKQVKFCWIKKWHFSFQATNYTLVFFSKVWSEMHLLYNHFMTPLALNFLLEHHINWNVHQCVLI